MLTIKDKVDNIRHNHVQIMVNIGFIKKKIISDQISVIPQSYKADLNIVRSSKSVLMQFI